MKLPIATRKTGWPGMWSIAIFGGNGNIAEAEVGWINLDNAKENGLKFFNEFCPSLGDYQSLEWQTIQIEGTKVYFIGRDYGKPEAFGVLVFPSTKYY